MKDFSMKRKWQLVISARLPTSMGARDFSKYSLWYNPRSFSDSQEICLGELKPIAAGNGQDMNEKYFEDFLKSVGARADVKLNPEHLTYNLRPKLMELQEQVWEKAPDTAKEPWEDW
jgi:hypothetical protein